MTDELGDMVRDDNSLMNEQVYDDSAYRAMLCNHLQGPVETLIEHYLHVSPADPGDQALLARTTLLQERVVLDALRELQRIDALFRNEFKRSEPAMLAPLGVIFDRIVSTLPEQRKFLSQISSVSVCPEYGSGFLLVDHKCDAAEINPMRWHHVRAIVEVTCHETFGPTSEATTVRIVDQARLQLNVNPFRLFSIILVIHSNKFTVVVVDRAGVLYSPPLPIYDEDGLTSTFIAVVQQLTHGLTDHQLGLDPTAERQPSTPDACSTYHIQPWMADEGEPVCTDVDQLVTIGEPIWSSVSPFGRGSAVWRVSSSNEKVVVVKTAWRHRHRATESAIYAHLRRLGVDGSSVPGIAAFVVGGDVAFDSDGQSTVSVNTLRPESMRIPEDLVLHRVALASVGKPLWEWKDEEELLLGFLAIVKGIEALDSLGITHRDISAGNVMLSVGDPRPGYEGFISDFEFAKIPRVPQEHSEQTTTTQIGTYQYMAYELLDDMVVQYHHPEKYTRVAHATHHDLESLIYVLSYATYRYVHSGRDLEILPAMTSTERGLFNKEFERFFGRVSIPDICDARRDLMLRTKGLCDKDEGQRVYARLPTHISALCQVLLTWLSKQYPRLSAPTFVTKKTAAGRVMARLRKLDPQLCALVDDVVPPPQYLTCASVKQTVTSFIAVYALERAESAPPSNVSPF